MYLGGAKAQVEARRMLFIQLRLSYFVAQVVAQLVYSTCAHAPAEASELALADAPQETFSKHYALAHVY